MRRGTRKHLSTLGAAALAVLVTPMGLPAAAVSADSEALLHRPAHGPAAVRALGADLTVAAGLNSMSGPEMRRLLLRDRTAWVHPSGHIYYVDRAPDGITVEPPARAPYPYDQTFQLHSRPGSSKTIYLDFDGQTVSGTQWNAGGYLLPAQTHPAFSTDADPSSFSNAERDLVQSVWQRVSEDYAPFDVDVTTADPGIEALRRTSPADSVFGTRALITPSTSAADTLCGGQCGGVAFLGTFDAPTSSDYFQPAWVFPQNLSMDTKAIAEAVSHEVGHNVGLSHDGIPEDDYYGGHGAWAPIMGDGYARPIVQWSRGEYAGATNSEDDLTVITQNGLSVLADDHGNAVGDATVVTAADRTTTGLVSTGADRDVLAFATGCTGPVTVAVTPAPTSPDLDVRVRLLSPGGSQLAVDDPVSSASSRDVATGLAATATTTVASGTTVYAEVDGVGARDPVTDGYSDYGSLGRYTASATGCGGGLVAFEQPTGSVLEGSGPAQLTVSRTGATTAPASVAYAVSGGTATQGADYDLVAGTLVFPPGASQASIPVPVTGDFDAEPDETIQVTLSSPSGDATLGANAVTTLTITDDDGTPPQPDLLISALPGSGYRGDDVYNNTGNGQTVTQKARRGQTRTFFVRLTNDGARSGSFDLSANEPPRGSTVTYLMDGTDVTYLLTHPIGVTLELAPDELAELRVKVRISRTAAIDSKKTAWLTAFSDSGGEWRNDAVKAVVKVVRG